MRSESEQRQIRHELSKILPNEIDALPEAILGRVIAGQDVEVVDFEGASRIDLKQIVDLVTATVQLVAAIITLKQLTKPPISVEVFLKGVQDIIQNKPIIKERMTEDEIKELIIRVGVAPK